MHISNTQLILKLIQVLTFEYYKMGYLPLTFFFQSGRFALELLSEIVLMIEIELEVLSQFGKSSFLVQLLKCGNHGHLKNLN